MLPPTPSPTITKQPTNPFSTFERSSDLHHNVLRQPNDHSVKTPQPSTTASQQQTWLPPPVAPRHTPQPVFSQDFELFQQKPTRPPASPRRAPSHAPTLLPTFNPAYQAAFYANGQINSTQQKEIESTLDRSTRPPVPLFHSNSTGNLAQNQNQFQQVNDITAFAMGGAGTSAPSSFSAPSSLTMHPANVAYDGTFGDLSAAGDADLFSYAGGYDFELMPAGDSFGSIDDGVVNAGTISPKDLLNDSVPPSTSFTNLTTPGSTLLDTPDDYQTSPLFTDSMAADNAWFSLFPEENEVVPSMERTSSNHIIVHPGGEGNARKRSSTQASPTFSPAVRHSDIAGVNARKRDKPLPPIVVDEADPVALKRARNTAAARKSRAKKVMEKDDLEAQITDLRAQVEFWKQKALAHGAPDVAD